MLFDHHKLGLGRKKTNMQLWFRINIAVFCLPGVPVRVDWDECMHLLPVHVDMNGLEIFYLFLGLGRGGIKL